MPKLTTLEILQSPFIFSQHGPLSTSSLARAAKKRGIRLDASALRGLHESGDLSPLAVMTDEQRQRPHDRVVEPPVTDNTMAALRTAQLEGKVFDPAVEPAASGEELRFDGQRVTDPDNWWNGLIYSRWQLLDADRIRDAITLQRHTGAIPWGTADVDTVRREYGKRQRRLALTVTLLEPRYLPEIERGWLHLRTFSDEEWFAWRDSYNPAAQLEPLGRIGVDLPEVLRLAENLLVRAHRLDPSGKWADLIRRAPRAKWESLTGDLATAMDQRVAAEILLRYYEDVGGPLPDISHDGARLWHPLDDRISERRESLDRVLMDLGVSPHPGAILLLEGETERRIVSQVFHHLRLDAAPNLVQVVTMNGVDKKPHLLATALVAPLLGQRRSSGYDLIRPPCHLIVAVDPEGHYRTEDHAERVRKALVATISEVVRAQGPDADAQQLDSFIQIRRWSERCFEFAHFSDDELLKAITSVHTKPEARPGDTALRASIAEARARGRDLKDVWRDWSFKPSKLDLADALWPALRAKIDAGLDDARRMPQVAEVVREAYSLAQRFSRGTWILGLDANEVAITDP